MAKGDDIQLRLVKLAVALVHKMKVVLKELNESLVWLSLIQDGEMLTEADVQRARAEYQYGQ